MIAWRVSVSALPHECQMVTVLPAGGGNNGGLIGSSVGVAMGVPVPGVDTTVGVPDPLLVALAVTDRAGVRVVRGVNVAGPGYDGDVDVNNGPG